MIMSFEKKSYRKQLGGRRNHSSSIAHPSSKRGNLKPLMTEDQKSSANIQELSYDFACRITRLFQYLTEDTEPMEQREQSLKLVC